MDTKADIDAATWLAERVGKALLLGFVIAAIGAVTSFAADDNRILIGALIAGGIATATMLAGSGGPGSNRTP